MPPAPEVSDGGGGVGIPKVLRGRKAQSLSQADGHIAVAGEVKVNLQQVAGRPQPGQGQIQAPRLQGKHPIGCLSQSGAQEHLFPQSHNESADTGSGFRNGQPPGCQLGGKLVIPGNGPGGDLREEGKVLQKVPKAAVCVFRTAVSIHQEADGLEQEEGHPQRGSQSQIRLHPHHLVQEKVQILENKEVSKVCPYPQNQQALSSGVEKPPPEKVEYRCSQQKAQCGNAAKGVEKQTQKKEKDVFSPVSGNQPIENQPHRQKAADKKYAVKAHGLLLSP